jgi:hypothetical protein
MREQALEFVYTQLFERSRKGNLTASQRKLLRHMVEMIRREEWPRRRLA